MSPSYRLATRALTLLALTSPLFATGCGDDGLGTRYPISGTVTYQGKNVPTGTINFIPDDPNSRGASSEIKDGSYSLTTSTPGDGAFAGKYKVTIESMNVDLAPVKAFVKSKGMDPEGQLPPGDGQCGQEEGQEQHPPQI